MVIDAIKRRTLNSRCDHLKPPVYAILSAASYVLIARVLRLLCGDPCQQEPPDKINAPRRLSVVPYRELQ